VLQTRPDPDTLFKGGHVKGHRGGQVSCSHVRMMDRVQASVKCDAGTLVRIRCSF